MIPGIYDNTFNIASTEPNLLSVLISKPFPQIETPRLILKEPVMTDWPTVSFLRSDPEVNRFVKRPSAGTKSKALDFINRISRDASNNKIIMWFIHEKSKPEMIGTICLWNFSEDRKTAEIGYDLAPNFQRRGMMNEALKGVINHGFKNLALDRIEAFTSHENYSSVKLLKRNNFILNKSRIDPGNPENIILECFKNQ